MKRGEKKDYRQATFRLPPDLLERLDSYSDRTGVVKTFVVEKSLREYLDSHDVPHGSLEG